MRAVAACAIALDAYAPRPASSTTACAARARSAAWPQLPLPGSEEGELCLGQSTLHAAERQGLLDGCGEIISGTIERAEERLRDVPTEERARDPEASLRQLLERKVGVRERSQDTVRHHVRRRVATQGSIVAAPSESGKVETPSSASASHRSPSSGRPVRTRIHAPQTASAG